MNPELAATHPDDASVTRTAYDSAADSFDDPILGFWDRCGRRTVELAKLHAGARVLDVGCGTGASALPAASAVGPRGSVLGIDLSEGLLRQARSKAHARGLDNTKFRVGDMTDLSSIDGEFDAVIAVFSIFFVRDMVEQVRRLWRLVRPGGRLAITTWGQGLFEPASSIFWSAIRELRPELEKRFSPWDQLTDVASLGKLFSAAGVPVPEIATEPATQSLSSAGDWWTIALGTGYRWTIDQLTSSEAAYVRARCLESLEASGCRSLRTSFICTVAQKISPTTTRSPLLSWGLL